MNIAGSRILVVGGTRRLGRLLALDLAAHGADVAISSRTGGETAAQTCADIAALGHRAVAVTGDLTAGDLTAQDSAAAIVDQAADALGGLDALVFAASGPFVAQQPEAIDQAAWDASLDTIAGGFFFAATAACRHFVEQPAGATPGRGVIVALTDTLGGRPQAAFAAHSAAKAAQIALVQALAKAWGAQGVRVCGIAPGPVELPDEPRREALQRAADRTVLGRPAQPDEIAAAVRFCLENDYLTGQNLAIDGGTLLI